MARFPRGLCLKPPVLGLQAKSSWKLGSSPSERVLKAEGSTQEANKRALGSDPGVAVSKEAPDQHRR